MRGLLRGPSLSPAFPAKAGGVLLVGFIVAFLLSPPLIIISTAFSPTTFPTFPPRGVSLRWFLEFLHDTDYLRAFKNSLIIALITTFISMTVGTMASFALDRFAFRGSEKLKSIFLSPLIFPKIILAIALVQLFYLLGLMATLPGLLIGHVIVTIPFVIQTVSASLSRMDRSLEEAAHTLGAGSFQVFFRVTLPLIIYGVIAGGIFSFVISFNEIYISLFLTGPRFSTLPVRIFADLDGDYSTIVPAVGTIIIAIVFSMFYIFELVFKKDISEYI